MPGHIMNSVSCNNTNLSKDNNKKILLTSISSHSHTRNLVFMQLLREFYGYEVMNLGACVPDELVLSTLKVATMMPWLLAQSTVTAILMVCV